MVSMIEQLIATIDIRSALVLITFLVMFAIIGVAYVARKFLVMSRIINALIFALHDFAMDRDDLIEFVQRQFVILTKDNKAFKKHIELDIYPGKNLKPPVLGKKPDVTSLGKGKQSKHGAKRGFSARRFAFCIMITLTVAVFSMLTTLYAVHHSYTSFIEQPLQIDSNLNMDNPVWFAYIASNVSASHEYVKDEYDCSEFSTDLWEKLRKAGYEARVVQGQYGSENESHAWVEVVVPIEATSGQIIPIGEYRQQYDRDAFKTETEWRDQVWDKYMGWSE